jgi:hypothetical protein
MLALSAAERVSAIASTIMPLICSAAASILRRFEQPCASDHLARAPGVPGDILQRRADLVVIDRLVTQIPLGGDGVGHDRAERLVDLMGNTRSQLPHLAESRRPGELRRSRYNAARKKNGRAMAPSEWAMGNGQWRLPISDPLCPWPMAHGPYRYASPTRRLYPHSPQIRPTSRPRTIGICQRSRSSIAVTPRAVYLRSSGSDATLAAV